MTTASLPPCVLTIAGADTGGGAGIQADTKTLGACGAYGLSAITALTAQDPDGVQAVWPVTPAQLHLQLECALRFQPRAIKVGMLGESALVEVVVAQLQACRNVPLVLDTPIHASSGAALLDEAGVRLLRERLVPLATILTPNRQEAAVLFPGMDEEDLREWSHDSGVAILLTGGDSHLAAVGEPRFCTDVFISGEAVEHLTLPRVETPNQHGTGCTLTAAMAAFLAHGFPLQEAVQYSRHFVQRALLAARPWAWPGNGPLNHFFAFDAAPIAPHPSQPLEEKP